MMKLLHTIGRAGKYALRNWKALLAGLVTIIFAAWIVRHLL